LGKFHIECVGIPPYLSHRYPRVLGIVTKSQVKKKRINSINYIWGDATQPQAAGAFIIAHVVNDKAQRWGGRGFAKYLKKKWPAVEKEFIKWRDSNSGDFRLGSLHKYYLDEKSLIISMIAQKGYGASFGPRIRYGALRICLQQLAQEALLNSASVHMPRIGCGEAGGSWNMVSELIDDELCAKGVVVKIYDLPPKENMQE
jgi:O-acetyl-ADP-ribose deacetylase (regulator of RNase III)